MVRRAPVEVLQPYIGRIFANAAFNRSFDTVNGPRPTPADALKRRLAVWEHDPDRCWELLLEHCEAAVDGESFADADVPYGELLVERIAAAGDRYEAEMLSHLQQPDGGPDDAQCWITGLMIILAGRTRCEAAIPHLLAKYEVDWDWYNEQIMYALVHIGTEPVLRAVAETYDGQPWYVRNYLTSVFENVHVENSIDYTLPRVAQEDDGHLRGQLGIALASQFDDRGIEPARDLYYEDPADGEREEIVTRLFTLACLADIDLLEKEDWGRSIEDDWNQFQERRAAAEQELAGIGRRLSAARSPKPVNDHIAGAFTATAPIVHEAPRIGRNDPCPCGSGKKYKKCCRTAEIR
jgi:hypothetical protein